MSEIIIKNFKGVYEKASTHDQPDTFAVECTDLIPTYEGKLVRRKGTRTAYLDEALFRTNGLAGNILSLFELQTGRASTDDVKYLCMTDDGTGKVYLWVPSTRLWTRIDNSLSDFRDAAGTVRACRWLAEDGAVRILAGGRSANVPLWWGYCGDRFLYAVSDTAGTNAKLTGGFNTYATAANVSTPNASTYLSLTELSEGTGVTWDQAVIEKSTDGLGHSGIYRYMISIQYDWKQWSALSPISGSLGMIASYFAGSDSVLRANLQLTFPAAVDRRMTGVRIYRARTQDSSYFENAYGTPYLLADIGVNDSIPGYTDNKSQRNWPVLQSAVAAVYTVATKTFKLSVPYTDDDALANDMLNGSMLVVMDGIVTPTYKYCLVSDTVFTSTSDQTIIVVDGTGLVDGTTYLIYAVRCWYKSGTDYKVSVVDCLSESAISAGGVGSAFSLGNSQVSALCPKYGTLINGQAFYANCYHNGEEKPHIVAYGYLTDDGSFANDVHFILNAFTQGIPLNGISSISNRLILYGPSAIFRGIVPSANERTWEMEREFDSFGLLAENSLISINGRNYFLASDWDIKEYDGVTRPRSIGSGIYDRLNTIGNTSLTYLQGAVAFYLAKLKMYVIRLQSAASSYEYWGLNLSDPDNPGWIKLAWKVAAGTDANYICFVTSATGETMAVTATNIYSIQDANVDTDDGYVVSPVYKTLPLFHDKKLKHHLRQIAVNYRSDTIVDMDVYLDGSSTAITQVSNELPAKTTLGVCRKNLPLGTVCDFFQVRLTLGASEAVQNSILEIDEVNVQLETSGGEV